MAKICGSCGHRTTERDPGWCPGCGLDSAWFDDVGDIPLKPGAPIGSGALVRSDALPTREIVRVKTGTGFDQVLGGGVPLGACLLLWGRGGVGKTRLAMALCARLRPAVFVSREMPEEMTAGYLDTLGVPRESTWVTREPNWRPLVVRVRPRLVVVDSISKWGHDAGHEMELAYEWAHQRRVTVVAICHATKRGDAKGSSELGHQCDTAIVVRARARGQITMHAPEKNRFAPTGVSAPVARVSILAQ